MKCCDVEPMIERSYNATEGGRNYLVFVMKCVNPQCANYKNTWEEKAKAD